MGEPEKMKIGSDEVAIIRDKDGEGYISEELAKETPIGVSNDVP